MKIVRIKANHRLVHLAHSLEHPTHLIYFALVASHGSYHLAAIGCLRSEEHTSELQSLMRISYAVFCLKKKITTQQSRYNTTKRSQITSSTNTLNQYQILSRMQ